MSRIDSPTSGSGSETDHGNPNETANRRPAVPSPAVGSGQPAAEQPSVIEPGSAVVGTHEPALDFRLELVLLLAVCILSVVVSFLVVFASVDLYFPADGGHYVGDADALLGRGVRNLRLPPLFPLVVAFCTLFASDIVAFQLSFAIALFLLPFSLFLFLRRWFGAVSSFVGSAPAVLTPAIGEIIGWGGGPTLLGVDLTILSLASFEWWVQRGGRRGLVAGALVGLTALTHPFDLVAVALFVGFRWMALFLLERSAQGEWSPFRWRGMLSFVIPLGAGLTLAWNYYARLKPLSLQSPNLALPWSILAWSFRESVAPIFLLLLGLLMPLPLLKRNLFAIAASVLALIIVVPAVVAWDPSYSSRVAYFLPILLGIGGACLSTLIFDTLQERRVPKWQVVAVAAALLSVSTLGAVFGAGYTERIEVATVYYQRLHPQDLPAFSVLRAGSGTVATSWKGGFQDEGIVSSWFVEGLAKRPALGPGAPWLSTLTDVGPAELDMQRFFSGALGIENGAVQASVSPTGGLRDPAIQGNIGGFYYPLAYINSLANSYPIPVVVDTVPARIGDTLQYRHNGTVGNGSVIETISLDRNSTVVTFELQGANVSVGDWDIWLWPAYYDPWLTVTGGGSDFRTTQTYREGVVTSDISVSETAATIQYYDVEPRWGLQAFEFRLQAAPSITLRVAVGGVAVASSTTSPFDEASLIARYDLTNVLLWNDTGWQPRFNSTHGYRLVMQTPDLIVYEIDPATVLAAAEN